MRIYMYSMLSIISMSLALQAYGQSTSDKPVLQKTAKQDTAAQEVKYRKASFQMIKYYFRPLGAMAKGKVPFDSTKAKLNADAVVTLSDFLLKGFQSKSLTDKSTSLPKIWDDWEGFNQEMQAFQKAAKNLSANTDSLGNFKTAFADTAKTCKSCHKGYRKKKKK